jgi:hypothetical protein
MVSEEGVAIRGFPNVLKVHEFLRGQSVLSGRDLQKSFAASRRRRSWRVWIIFATLGVLPLAGCQDFNPYLGAAATQASTIAFITPSSRPAGCSGFILDVQGIDFTSTSSVDWNGSPRATNFESSGELLATISSTDLATAAPVSIVVDTPVSGQNNQGNNLSNFVSFTIGPTPIQGTSSCPGAPTFPPTLLALNAPSGTVGSTLEIAGNYFGGVQGTSTVTLNGITATVTSWSGTLIQVTVPTVPLNGASSVSTTVLVTVNGVVSIVPTPGSNLFTVLSSGSTSSVIRSSVTASAGASDPRFVAMVASAADPSAPVTGFAEVFLRDTCHGAPTGCSPDTIPVSVGFDGTEPNGASRSPSVSANGRFVVFASDANNLVPGDANGVTDVFVRDTCVGAQPGCVPHTTRASTGPDGIEPNAASTSPSISLDGRFVAFQSAATNLAPDTTASAANPAGRFLWDSCLGAANGCRSSLTKLKFLSSPH